MPAKSTINLWLRIPPLSALFIWLYSQCKYRTELQSSAEILLLHDSPIPFHIFFQACNDRISWGLIAWNSTCISGHNFLIFSDLKTFVSTKYLSYGPLTTTDKVVYFPHKHPKWRSLNPNDYPAYCANTPPLPQEYIPIPKRKLHCFTKMSPLKEHKKIKKAVFLASHIVP